MSTVPTPAPPPAVPNLNEIQVWIADVLYPWMLAATGTLNLVYHHEVEEAEHYAEVIDAEFIERTSKGVGAGRELWDDVKEIVAFLRDVRDTHIEHFL